MADINLDNYEPVDERIARFKNDHPNFRVVTEEWHEGEPGATRWIVKASVWRDAENTGLPDGTGYAFEIDGQGMTQRTAALETCETSAIGRALANLGYAGNRKVTREEMIKPAVAQFEDRVAAAQSEAELRSIWVEAQAQGLEKRIQGAVNKRKAEVTA
ncbi:hypothetical protein [Dietzia cinnamea]|uniref:hypothetical protein n=1 Tax=Dietzia cinnamea TaxID=321318 RepID=UPI0021A4DB12|nr:hypothetical protein [Dietzia cinnamea]MCT2122634.1 hypothetical protein [Dietzia cinnamea]